VLLLLLLLFSGVFLVSLLDDISVWSSCSGALAAPRTGPGCVARAAERTLETRRIQGDAFGFVVFFKKVQATLEMTKEVNMRDDKASRGSSYSIENLLLNGGASSFEERVDPPSSKVTVHGPVVCPGPETTRLNGGEVLRWSGTSPNTVCGTSRSECTCPSVPVNTQHRNAHVGGEYCSQFVR